LSTDKESVWPDLCWAALRNPQSGLRIGLGMSLWVGYLPEVQALCPEGMVGSEGLGQFGSVRESEADTVGTGTEDTIQPESRGCCPLFNSLAICGHLAAEVLDAVQKKSPDMSCDKAAVGLKSLQEVAEQVIPGALTYAPGSVPIFDRWSHLQTRLLYGVLFCNGSAAYDAETSLYSWDGKELSVDDLLAELVSLVRESDGWVKTIVEPFHRQDLQAHAKLRSELQGVQVFAAVPESMLPGSSEVPPEPPASPGAPVSPSISPTMSMGSAGEYGEQAVRETAWSLLGVVRSTSTSPGPTLLRLEDHALKTSATMDVALSCGARIMEIPSHLDLGITAHDLPSSIGTLSARFHDIVSRASENSLDGSDGMRLDEENFLEALSRVGYGKVDTVGISIFNFLDETNDKSISSRTFRELDTFTKMASFEELDELCGFLLEQTNDSQDDPGSLRKVFDAWDVAGNGYVIFPEFKRGLDKFKWDRKNERELFAGIDAANKGFLEWEDFHALAMLSAMFRLRRVERAQAGFLEGFESKTAAFKALDVLNAGKLTLHAFLQAFGSLMPSNPSDGAAAFQFMDKEEKDVITMKEFESLLSFSRGSFESDLAELARFMEAKYPGTEEESSATVAFINCFCTGERKSMAPSAVVLNVSDFEKGFNRLAVSTSADAQSLSVSIDGRALFHFLDCGGARVVTLQEWLILERIVEVERFVSAANVMQESIDHFVHFFRTQYSSFDEAYAALLEAISD
jgi:Ca2+-binding EF-hand superfamily protein